MEKAKIKGIRINLNISKRRNIAYAEIHLDGRNETLVGISGKATRTSTVSNPKNRFFKVEKVNGFLKDFDSEVKILEKIASSLNKNSKGIIFLYSEFPICRSCMGVIKQFKVKFPKVKIVYGGGQ